ncbi:MAG TPA: 16S rRNA (guanine(966)-N(2))-methyltransferase RsmD [Steroidobacteraceae bacterium]|nr:16S rRNA (guanine(966)-N(2))-methyltransferase RsmD [Steroidobacteraceae bacterium]
MPRTLRKKTAGKKTAQHAPNRLRIIGGRWRGSRIVFPPLAAIRPSPDRVRETLFNWLQQPIVGARCLDLFAGSGALGLEALSRGAAHVTFVDREPQIGRHLSQTLERLGSRDATVVVEDALRFLSRPPQPFDIVFLDPPFDSGVLQQVGGRLQGWLAPGAHVYVECPADRSLAMLPAHWAVQRTKRAGQVGYHLLRAGDPANEPANEVPP